MYIYLSQDDISEIQEKQLLIEGYRFDMGVASVAYRQAKEESIELLREAYNALNGITGLDGDVQVKNESSLSRRIREFINK